MVNIRKQRKRRKRKGVRKRFLQRKNFLFHKRFLQTDRYKKEMTNQDRKEFLFWLKPFPARTCAVFFPFTTSSGFVLSKCLQPSFVVSHPFSWHVCRYLRRQFPLRIWVLLTVLFLTLKEQDFAPVRWSRKSMKSTYSYPSSYRTRLGSKIASKRLLRQWPPRRLRLQNIEQRHFFGN